MAQRNPVGKKGDTRPGSQAAILEFLRSRGEQACFISELVASLGDPGLRSEEVEACLRQLHQEGQVWLEEFVAPDPHLPPRILVASAIDPSASAGAARGTRPGRASSAPSMAGFASS